MKKLTKTQQVAKLRKLLIKACNAHLKAGGKIVNKVFRGADNECCPIMCATHDDLSYESVIAKSLGLKENNALSRLLSDFMRGFDDDLQVKNTAAYKLGIELRKKYIKEAK